MTKIQDGIDKFVEWSKTIEYVIHFWDVNDYNTWAMQTLA